MVMSKIRKV